MTPLRALVYSACLCAAFGLPSFCIAALERFNLVARGVGAGFYFAAALSLALSPWAGRWISDAHNSKSVVITILVRALGSIMLFPCGVFDVFCGMNSLSTVLSAAPTPAQKSDFWLTLQITLMQGAFMATQCVVYIVAIRGLFFRSPSRPNPDICANCGYDVRASREFRRCPECGAPCTPPSASVSTDSSGRG